MVISIPQSTSKNQQKKCYIYKHIRLDTNEVFYIGKGTNNSNNYRRSKSKYGRNRYWHNIVNKHGYKIEIVIENLSETEANKIEIEYISKYGRISLGTGTLVNMTDGGEGVSGHKHSKETKEKLRKVSTGNKNCLGKKNWSGKKHKEESIKKIRQSKYKFKKRVGQYKDGKLIKEYSYIGLVKEYGFQRELVSKCCRGKRKTHKGYEWKYIIDPTDKDKIITFGFGRKHNKETIEKIKNSKKYSFKKVGKYKDGKLIKEYPSVHSTTSDGYCYKQVSACCNGKHKSHKNFQWKFIT